MRLSQMRLSFRGDVDYLRAIAVFSVIGFHYDVPGFGGGFVGVDIFFVISGFLISRLIWADIRVDSFSFANFYERRARRLLPALYVVLLATGICAWHLAPPHDYRAFFESAVATLLFGSNIYFWTQAGYFDLPGISKVLLHTWSLSVEEQFYFVFPLATWLWSKCFRDPSSRWSLLLVVGGAVGLCVLDELMIKQQAQAAFYLSPLRAWEFLIGGVVYLAERWSPSDLRIRCALALAGLAAMLLPVALFSPETRFPGVHALLPCLGAAVFLFAFNREGARPPLPAEAALLFFGKISYSLYLWHWPVFVLGTAALPRDWATGPLSSAVFLLGSIVLADVTYRLVEAPARATVVWKHMRVTRLIAVASSLLIAIASAGIIGNGYPDRYPQAQQRMLRYDAAALVPYYRQHVCFLDRQEPISVYRSSECLAFAGDRKNVLIVGDSTAAHYVPALQDYFATTRYELLQLNSAGCAPLLGMRQEGSSNCNEVTARIGELIRSRRLSAIIISAHWRAYLHRQLPPPAVTASERSDDPAPALDSYLGATLAAARDADLPVLLFGPSIEFPVPLASSLVSRELTHFPPDKSFIALEASFAADDHLRQLSRRYENVKFISVLQAACPNRICPLTANTDTPIVWDTLHLTPEGSHYVLERLKPQLDGFFRSDEEAPSSLGPRAAAGALQ
ncbi:acyltransferase family protein [Bradyrhizobium sp. SRS-191]|uniref:acyltransferase family protein n=1 Tax=Bradyrhizobium sp. SRS-191 TaxID=2962606 RepID=UPI00211E5F77|nr:acyltransferase family protein [Bradyrhizobium sp. SRS-191]